jgi:sarcosine oxidase
MGASHGTTRNFNIAYVDPEYQRMVQEAAELWRQLESDAGVSLLDLVGQTNHGPGIDPNAAETLRSLGVRASMLEPEQAQERWPGIRYDTRVLYMPDGGRVNAEEAVATLQSETARHGGEVLLETPVEEIRIRSDDSVEVATSDVTYIARRVVVTVGAWTQRLLGAVIGLPRLVVTQEQPAHFAVADSTAVWPSFNHFPAPTGHGRYDYWYSLVYGMLTPDEGVKAGWHGVGAVVDPDARSFEA